MGKGGTVLNEKDVENYLKKEVAKLGGKAYKWVSPGNAGVPDRIVLLPGGKIIFVELKGDGGRLSNLQALKIAELKRIGADVRIIKSRDEVDDFITRCKEVIRGAICST